MCWWVPPKACRICAYVYIHINMCIYIYYNYISSMNNNVVEDDGAEATFPMAGFFGGQPNEFDLGVVHDSYLGSKERSEFWDLCNFFSYLPIWKWGSSFFTHLWPQVQVDWGIVPRLPKWMHIWCISFRTFQVCPLFPCTAQFFAARKDLWVKLGCVISAVEKIQNHICASCGTIIAI